MEINLLRTGLRTEPNEGTDRCVSVWMYACHQVSGNAQIAWRWVDLTTPWLGASPRSGVWLEGSLHKPRTDAPLGPFQVAVGCQIVPESAIGNMAARGQTCCVVYSRVAFLEHRKRRESDNRDKLQTGFAHHT
jgi:hypothetical protein